MPIRMRYQVNFKQNLTGFNFEVFLNNNCFQTKVKELCLSYYLSLAGVRIIGFKPFPRVLTLWEIQAIRSSIWNRFTLYISYDGNY